MGQIHRPSAGDDAVAAIVAEIGRIARRVNGYVAGDGCRAGDVLVTGQVDVVAGEQDVASCSSVAYIAVAIDLSGVLGGVEQVSLVAILPVVVVDYLVVGGGYQADG